MIGAASGARAVGNTDRPISSTRYAQKGLRLYEVEGRQSYYLHH